MYQIVDQDDGNDAVIISVAMTLSLFAYLGETLITKCDFIGN